MNLAVRPSCAGCRPGAGQTLDSTTSPSSKGNPTMSDLTDAKVARGRSIFTAIRDTRRGWRINWKALGVAYVVEASIIGSSLAAGIQFANRYADNPPSSIAVAQIGGWNLPVAGHSEAWWIAVIATLAFCVA